jgi:hypothetical protein
MSSSQAKDDDPQCFSIHPLWIKLIFSSRELKAQMSYSDHLLSVFYIFDFSRTTGPILTKLGTNHPWEEWIQICSNEGDFPSQSGDNSKRVKIH